MDQLADEFIAKHKNDIYANHHVWISVYKDGIKDAKSFNYDKDKKLHDVINTVAGLFYDEFWKKEAVTSTKYMLIPPFVFNKNNTIHTVIAHKKTPKDKMKVKLSYVFAIYSQKKKQLHWMDTYIRIKAKEWFGNHPFLSANTFNNVTESQADKLAIWFRVVFYDCGFEYKNKKLNVAMKTHNLVIFDIQDTNKDVYSVYALTDLGIKDPPYKKLSHKLGIYHMAWTFVNNKDKDKYKPKGGKLIDRHTISIKGGSIKYNKKILNEVKKNNKPKKST